MSNKPKKGMHLDTETQCEVFDEVDAAPQPGLGKTKFKGEVVRVVLDGRGHQVKKTIQTCEVFATEETVHGKVISQCPSELAGVEGEVKTHVRVWPL